MNDVRNAQTADVFAGLGPWGNRLYWAGCLVIIATAAILRFYALPANSLWLDEAVAANNAGGTFEELVEYTRFRNSSPILYPLILYVIQKWQSTALTVRMVSAACSALTVAGLALLLPRVGIGRRTALLAGLLAALSTAAVMQAQDVREYSTDAWVALLLMVGMLAFLQDNRKQGLLCAALFAAPLLQYNLVLFGIAVLGTAAIHWAVRRRSGAETDSGKFLSLPALAGPLICFLAGCGLTALITLRFHWQDGGFGSAGYLNPYYYLGSFQDVQTLAHFIGTRTWQLMDYHLAPIVSVGIGAVLGLLVVGVMVQRKGHAVVTLFLLTMALAIGAALARIYPLGHIRQCLYLGPVIYVTAAFAIVWVLDNVRPERLRRWTGPIGLGLALGGIAAGSIVDLRAAELYEDKQPVKDILALLEAQADAEDLVFVSGGAQPAVRFHHERDLNYHFGRFENSFEDCWRDLHQLLETHQPAKLWVVGSHYPVCQGWHILALQGDRVQVEHLFYHPSSQLHAITTLPAPGAAQPDTGWMRDPLQAVDDFLQTQTAAYADGNAVYLYQRKLVYVADPCAPADRYGTVHFQASPVDADQPTVFGYLGMQEYALRMDEKCVAVYPLPDYPLQNIRINQSNPGQGTVWSAEFDVAAAP